VKIMILFLRAQTVRCLRYKLVLTLEGFFPLRLTMIYFKRSREQLWPIDQRPLV